MYYYFAGKHQVLGFLVRDYLDNLAIAISDAVSEAEDPTSRLVALVRAHLAWDVVRISPARQQAKRGTSVPG